MMKSLALGFDVLAIHFWNEGISKTFLDIRASGKANYD
jgi:hypothetical protein